MTLNTEDTSTDLSDEQIDSLVDRAESSTNREIPMTEAERETPATPAPKDDKFIEFMHEGKPVKATVDEVVKWAQMGRNYPQKAQALNQAKAKWEAERADWEQKYSPYKQIDEWATQNPDKWTALQNQWKGINSPQAGTPTGTQVDPKIQALEAKLGQFEQFIQQTAAEKAAIQSSQEDQKLDTDLKSLKDQYKDIDFDTLDEEGKSLEFKVLEHATQNGIQNVKTAFRDFYHDQLLARERTSGQQAVAKGIQKNAKMGILGTSPTPRKGFSAPTNLKTQSYEDLAREAIEEMRAQG